MGVAHYTGKRESGIKFEGVELTGFTAEKDLKKGAICRVNYKVTAGTKVTIPVSASYEYASNKFYKVSETMMLHIKSGYGYQGGKDGYIRLLERVGYTWIQRHIYTFSTLIKYPEIIQNSPTEFIYIPKNSSGDMSTEVNNDAWFFLSVNIVSKNFSLTKLGYRFKSNPFNSNESPYLTSFSSQKAGLYIKSGVTRVDSESSYYNYSELYLLGLQTELKEIPVIPEMNTATVIIPHDIGMFYQNQILLEVRFYGPCLPNGNAGQLLRTEYWVATLDPTTLKCTLSKLDYIPKALIGKVKQWVFMDKEKTKAITTFDYNAANDKNIKYIIFEKGNGSEIEIKKKSVTIFTKYSWKVGSYYTSDYYEATNGTIYVRNGLIWILFDLHNKPYEDSYYPDTRQIAAYVNPVTGLPIGILDTNEISFIDLSSHSGGISIASFASSSPNIVITCGNASAGDSNNRYAWAESVEINESLTVTDSVPDIKDPLSTTSRTGHKIAEVMILEDIKAGQTGKAILLN